MLIDRRGWCYERTADSLIRYHGTKHQWTKVCAIEPNGKQTRVIPPADLYRVGGVPLHLWYLNHAKFPKAPLIVPTFSSFVDLDEWSDPLQADGMRHVPAVIVNDARMREQASALGVRVLYTPDRVDPEVFYPMPALRPKGGPLRIGWAGSEKFWKDQKHVAMIRLACNLVGEQVKFIRQDREKDGLKSPAEMRRWINSLDVYITINDERTCTPVTQLEAAACGVPFITTKCGELWPHMERVQAGLIVPTPALQYVSEAIHYAIGRTRGGLQAIGRQFRQEHHDSAISWKCGEAKRVTLALERIVRQRRQLKGSPDARQAAAS
jgi:glycosyltransferase involved in cell wall biosynthesis